MTRQSAGLLMFRIRDNALEVFLVHPGGPFWSARDLGVWSIPKGEFEAGEDPIEAARREFGEETGLPCAGVFIPLEPVRQKGGKVVFAWAFEGDANPAAARSNTFAMEWPPHSGLMQVFPEVDRAAWFTLKEARARINAGQAPLLDELARTIAGGSGNKKPSEFKP